MLHAMSFGMAKQDLTIAAAETIEQLTNKVNTTNFMRVSSVRGADRCMTGIAAMIFVSGYSTLAPEAQHPHLGDITVYASGRYSAHGMAP
jgi:hypothetical protein